MGYKSKSYFVYIWFWVCLGNENVGDETLFLKMFK